MEAYHAGGNVVSSFCILVLNKLGYHIKEVSQLAIATIIVAFFLIRDVRFILKGFLHLTVPEVDLVQGVYHIPVLAPQFVICWWTLIRCDKLISGFRSEVPGANAKIGNLFFRC